jgi:hypothetical protein
MSSNGWITKQELDFIIKSQMMISENQIDEKIKKSEEKIRAMGCGTEVGCLAGKRHEAMHADKLDSDIQDFKNFKRSTEEENKIVSKKMSELLIMFNDVLNRMQSMLTHFDFVDAKIKATDKCVDDNKKETGDSIKDFDRRIWGIFVAIFLMVLTSIWSVMKVNSTVGKINSTDIANQGNTEAWMAVLAVNQTGKPVEQILREYYESKKKIEQKSGGK